MPFSRHWLGVVFIPGIGVLTLVPLAGLVAAQIFLPSFRQRNVAYLTGAGGLILLIHCDGRLPGG